METELIDKANKNKSLVFSNDYPDVELHLVNVSSSQQDESRRPYYLENFQFIIKEIFKDSFYDKLFDDFDRGCVEQFNKLSDKSKIIYLVLFRRSRKLHRLKSIRFSENLDDKNLDEVFKELSNVGFISSDYSKFTDEELLNLLDKPELIKLSSTLKLRIKGVPKKSIVEALLKSANSPSLLDFFSSPKSGVKSRLRKLTEDFLGSCFFVEESPSLVLLRILFCFSLTSEKLGAHNHPISFEGFLSNELYSLFQVRNGDVTYPQYEILRKSEIFRSREDLLRAFEFTDLWHQLNNFVLTSKFLDAYNLFMQRLVPIKDAILKSEFNRGDLPVFLRSYTCPNIAFRIVRLAISVCERLRKYSEAVELINLVLASEVVHSISSKSICFLIKRLLLDQGIHSRDRVGCLKKLLSLLPILKNLHPGHRLDIQRQLCTLTGITSDNDKIHLHHESADRFQKPPRKRRKTIDNTEVDLMKNMENLISDLIPSLKSAHVVKISAPINMSSVEIGVSRPFYLWHAKESSSSNVPKPTTSILHVEEWALKHYTNDGGFEKGVHCESGVYTTLCGLLFYDLIFGISRPDAFYSMRQSAPLDLFTGEFYSSQKTVIEKRLDMIESAERNVPDSEKSLDPISRLLLETWKNHNGEHCVGINWELFHEDDIVDLFWCLSPKVVAAFCRLLISNYSNWCSGLPDLCIWSPSKEKAKLIEVKGPGDKLSSQQIIWIDQLLSFGANVEICSIKAVPRGRYEPKAQLLSDK